MPTMIPMFQPRGETIAELLMRQGEIQGRSALMRGEAVARGIQGVGEAVAHGVMAYGQKKDQQKREAMLDAAMASFDPANPMDFYRRTAVAVGPEAAMRVTSGMASLMKLQEQQKPDPKDAVTVLGGIAALVEKAPGTVAKNWPQMRTAVGPYAQMFGLPVPEEYTPEVGQGIVSLYQGLGGKQEKPGTRLVERTLPDGSKVQEIVEDKPGQTFTSAAPPPKPENLTGEEAYIRATYGEKPTAQQMLEGRARYASAGREPKAPEQPRDYTFNPEGVVLSSYGMKERDEVRRQARERDLPVFETAASQGKAVTLASIAADAKELNTLLALDKVKSAVGPAAGRWTLAKGSVFDLDPDVQRAMQLMVSLSDTELRKRSGAAINEGEMRRILSFATDPKKTLSHNTTAVNGLLKSAARDYKALSGGVDIGMPAEEEAPKRPAAVPANYRWDAQRNLWVP